MSPPNATELSPTEDNAEANGGADTATDADGPAHEPATPSSRPAPGAARRRVALAGNPNSGKSSLFNGLTGARQHVGNYPGVTVEKRAGHYLAGGTRYEVTDLPGTYSLTSFSPEERIAQDVLLAGEQDVVVVIVDSTTLSRSLVLLSQVMLLRANAVLCLNMSDEAEKAGQQLDIVQMRELLGMPIVETVGHRAIGIDRLREAIADACERPTTGSRLVLGERLDRALAAIVSHLQCEQVPPRIRGWLANKLLVGDTRLLEDLAPQADVKAATLAEADRQRVDIESATGVDISLFVTERHFGFVDGLLKEVVRRRARVDARVISDRIDSVLVNKTIGLPIFALVMYLIFWLTFTLGEVPMGWIEQGFEALGAWASSLWSAGAESPLRSLLIDGVVAGVGGVIVFLPNVLLLFLGLAVLEDTGYMARAAFLMDRVMHRFGLHGKSFVPMMTGFGCSIPGIMATRTLENERDRLTTMLVLPLMSCGARLPIWLLLIPAFFAPTWRAPMLFAIYSIGIALAFGLSLLLRKSVLKGEEAPFVMELPPYRLPTTKAVVAKMIERGGLYLRKAGTTILGVSILMWLVTAYPKTAHYRVDADIDAGRLVLAAVGSRVSSVSPPGVTTITAHDAALRRAAEDLRGSFAGMFGRAIEPVLRPLGFDWKLGTAMVGAFAAKEVFVAQMGVVYSLGEAGEKSVSLQEAIRHDYSPLVGFCLMLFLLVATPCMATVAITRRESGSWKWAFLQFGGLTAIAYVLVLVVYQFGRLWL